MPILAFDAEIRTVICSTNTVASVHARIRRAVRARGHFPNEGAVVRLPRRDEPRPDPTRPDPTRPNPTRTDRAGQGRRRWTMRWKPTLNAFEMAIEGRRSAGRK
ncbi:transposase [Micromonospora sp. WMMD967]|uniref:transposase n=1 Tax=Micromonospora sp. WMMD967 TaxID=3016101 RepID=UPI0024164E8E|nr:transposase [Micromonospora sp. WMMD967]MDG4838461.1 transposase [Micromonospora sp. WMMD967]